MNPSRPTLTPLTRVRAFQIANSFHPMSVIGYMRARSGLRLHLNGGGLIWYRGDIPLATAIADAANCGFDVSMMGELT